MKGRIVAPALLLVSACHSAADDKAVPTPANIARLEAKLAQHPCVTSLENWERNYRFSRKAGFIFPGSLNPDLDVIELHLRRAGAITIRPGRHVMTPGPGGDWPDSRPIESIDGKYTLSTGALALQRCKPR